MTRRIEYPLETLVTLASSDTFDQLLKFVLLVVIAAKHREGAGHEQGVLAASENPFACPIPFVDRPGEVETETRQRQPNEELLKA